MSASVHRRVRLRNEEILFPIARQIIDIVGNATVVNLAIRRFDETEFVDARKGRHRTDETDVRAFRRFNRTNASVVRRMHVAHFKSSAIAAESAWSERGKTTFVRQFGERI